MINKIKFMFYFNIKNSTITVPYPMETTTGLIQTAKDIHKIRLQVRVKLWRGFVMKTKRTYDINTIWKHAEWIHKTVNIAYIKFLDLSFNKYSLRPGRIRTYYVTETSAPNTARHPIVTYVGEWSFFDTATKHTVIEFQINPMQKKFDAALTTYIFALVLRFVPMHNFY